MSKSHLVEVCRVFPATFGSNPGIQHEEVYSFKLVFDFLPQILPFVDLADIHKVGARFSPIFKVCVYLGKIVGVVIDQREFHSM